MTVTDQIKILDRKTPQNEAQYDSDRKAAKISPLFSNNFGKYKYLTGEDLVWKTSTVEQPRFEYSSLVKIFNKGLSEDNKKQRLFKRLKNIGSKNEDQTKKQSDAVKNINISSKPLKTIGFFSTLSDEAKQVIGKR